MAGSCQDLLSPSSIRELILPFLQEEMIPLSSFSVSEIESVIFPLLSSLLSMFRSFTRKEGEKKAFVVGLCGSQGSGKTTLSEIMRLVLCEIGINCFCVSLDDFYLSKAKREELSKLVHPLLETRGVPGTHDVDLLREVFQFFCGKEGKVFARVPTFDKKLDDVGSIDRWTSFSRKKEEGEAEVFPCPDIVILEGWCVCVPPLCVVHDMGGRRESLQEPVNGLEEREDEFGTWRQYVEEAIVRDYQPFWDEVLDFFIFLRVPSFEKVVEWRREQEQKLLSLKKEEARHLTAKIERFCAHFQRLTMRMLHCTQLRGGTRDGGGKKADAIVEIERSHALGALKLAPIG